MLKANENKLPVMSTLNFRSAESIALSSAKNSEGGIPREGPLIFSRIFRRSIGRRR